MLDTTEERKLRYARALIDSISPEGRMSAERYYLHKLNAGLKRSSIYNLAHVLKLFDERLGGKAHQGATEADLVGFVAVMRKGEPDKPEGRKPLAGPSIHQNCQNVKTDLRDVLDVDELPRWMNRALRVKRPKPAEIHRLVSDDEFGRLLAACRKWDDPRKELRAQAMLWILRDAGVRFVDLEGWYAAHGWEPVDAGPGEAIQMCAKGP